MRDQKKAKITFVMLACLAVEAIVMAGLYRLDTDEKDAFMLPCVQHHDVASCLAQWKARR
ncbi:hypothetical protein [Gluconacetobacter diazotrophicus]|uniref:Uncharacterized protein n=1 Tax=Gluconacetobacter diazotrophicus (strain ATCC 49037 / DSM 5601 / CCUG 37298 / CIP 103539 / LMG 7603 / PAl5) TaxID=272568 RepID=A9HT92_GLUDA|nr:hypothetical protein [Gluconacetobacter diazotrophicus]CAP57878.1 hypothetical protein GDI3914 [Gluconacetobacter diazotrophicus PA1 5]